MPRKPLVLAVFRPGCDANDWSIWTQSMMNHVCLMYAYITYIRACSNERSKTKETRLQKKAPSGATQHLAPLLRKPRIQLMIAHATIAIVYCLPRIYHENSCRNMKQKSSDIYIYIELERHLQIRVICCNDNNKHQKKWTKKKLM